MLRKLGNVRKCTYFQIASIPDANIVNNDVTNTC